MDMCYEQYVQLELYHNLLSVNMITCTLLL